MREDAGSDEGTVLEASLSLQVSHFGYDFLPNIHARALGRV